MVLTPVHDLILVEHLPADVFRQESGRVFLPNRMEFDPVYARVIAMGPGRSNEYGTAIPPICKVGDLLLLYPKAGHPVKTPEGRELWFIQPGNAMAVVTDVEIGEAKAA